MRTPIAVLLLMVATFAAGQAPPQLNLMPMPSRVQLGTGHLLINQSFSVAVSGYGDGTLERGVQRFVADLSHRTGLRLYSTAAKGVAATLVIQAQHARQSGEKLREAESSGRPLSESGAKLTATNPLGIW